MVKLIPSTKYRTTKSRGEINLFNKFYNDKKYDDWVILHSQDMLERERKWMGEIDYIVIIPKKGVVCIEIKSCFEPYPKIKDGCWFYNATQEKNNKPDTDGPFVQAKNNTQDLRDFLKNTSNNLKDIIFTRMIIFTDSPFKQKSAEWLDFEYVDVDDLGENYNNIFKLIINTIDKFRLHCVNKDGFGWFNNTETLTPKPEQTKKILNILRPDYENYLSPDNRRKKLINELKKYTEEQFEILDNVSQNERIIVNSPAGTGKTLLAIEMARRSFMNKEKSLFICFNNLLGKTIRNEMEPLSEYITFFTFSQLLIEISKVDLTKIDTSKTSFWRDELKVLVYKHIDKSKYKRYIDHLIIDEAQDITTSDNLLILSSLLKNDLTKSKLSIFGDYEWQSVYNFANSQFDYFDPSEELIYPNKIKDEYCNDLSLLNLRVNCRNSVGISNQAQIFGGMNPPYKKVLRPDDNTNPIIKKYKDLVNQYEQIFNILNLLKKQNYKDEDIVILSLSSKKSAAMSGLIDYMNEINAKIKYQFSYENNDFGKKGMIFSTSIRSFKGLESPVVIITDIEQDKMNEEETKSLLYTGITRCVEKLYLLIRHNNA